MDLVNKGFKTVVMTISYMFKKLEERLSMLTRDIEYMSRNENYNV